MKKPESGLCRNDEEGTKPVETVEKVTYQNPNVQRKGGKCRLYIYNDEALAQVGGLKNGEAGG